MSSKKYHRYIFQIEVLSEESLPDDMTLSAIEYEITNGHCSGKFLDTFHQELDEVTCAEYLQKHGSDPEFFGINIKE